MHSLSSIIVVQLHTYLLSALHPAFSFEEDTHIKLRPSKLILCSLDRASLWWLKNKRPTWWHLLFYFTSYVPNMFQTLIYPSSCPCDYSVELKDWSYCSWYNVCWSFGVVGLEWYVCCRLRPSSWIPLQIITSIAYHLVQYIKVCILYGA